MLWRWLADRVIPATALRLERKHPGWFLYCDHQACEWNGAYHYHPTT